MEKMDVKEIMARAYDPWAWKCGTSKDQVISLNKIDAAIDAMGNAGFQIVPVEPTEAMMDAAIEEMMKPRMHVGSYKHDKGPDAWAAYKAMLKSAQT